MPGPARVVLVGGGLAAAKTAQSLRKRGYEGELTLLTAEPHRPYERPGLSKGYLNGSEARDALFVHDADWYRQQGVDLHTAPRWSPSTATAARCARRPVTGSGTTASCSPPAPFPGACRCPEPTSTGTVPAHPRRQRRPAGTVRRRRQGGDRGRWLDRAGDGVRRSRGGLCGHGRRNGTQPLLRVLGSRWRWCSPICTASTA